MHVSACCRFEQEGKQQRFVRYAAEFISFDKRQKKRTKEKRFPRQSSPRVSLLSGFFDSPSWLGRKTAHIPVRRPPGFPLILSFEDFLRQKTTKKPLQALLLLQGQRGRRLYAP
jgi:hypothetical protein